MSTLLAVLGVLLIAAVGAACMLDYLWHRRDK